MKLGVSARMDSEVRSSHLRLVPLVKRWDSRPRIAMFDPRISLLGDSPRVEANELECTCVRCTDNPNQSIRNTKESVQHLIRVLKHPPPSVRVSLADRCMHRSATFRSTGRAMTNGLGLSRHFSQSATR